MQVFLVPINLSVWHSQLSGFIKQQQQQQQQQQQNTMKYHERSQEHKLGVVPKSYFHNTAELCGEQFFQEISTH